MAGRREPLQAAEPVPVQSPHPFFSIDTPRNACAMTGLCLCHGQAQQVPLERATGCSFHSWRQKPSPGGSAGSHSTGRTPKAKSWLQALLGRRAGLGSPELCAAGWGSSWSKLCHESSLMPGPPFILGEIITRCCRELGLVGLPDAKGEETGRCG